MKEAQRELSSSGIDTQAVVGTTKAAVAQTEQAVTAAKPALEQALTFLTTTDPIVLGEYALGLAALYYLVSADAPSTQLQSRTWGTCATCDTPFQILEASSNAKIRLA